MFDLLCWWVWVLIMVLMAVNPLNSVFGFWWAYGGWAGFSCDFRRTCCGWVFDYCCLLAACDLVFMICALIVLLLIIDVVYIVAFVWFVCYAVMFVLFVGLFV